LTASGYLIARERIELSPRFLGVVKWIGVKKGDAVTNGQVVVRLDDTEYQARLTENDAQIAVAQVGVERAELDLKRAEGLVASRVEMQKLLDDARLAKASAVAQLKQVHSTRVLLQTYVDWCVIRSPVNGVVLDKLVDPNELVTPQTFGTGRGPSTSLIAVADLSDLQVEVDVSESDLSKVHLGQRCVVSPEAYPDQKFAATVAEIAPEANRAKGTLQVKVQIREPNQYLTPELSAKVQFFAK
jgi:RND family efflux transporter MFP subunit